MIGAAHLGERLLLAAAIASACVAAWFILRAVVLGRAGRAPSLSGFVPGRPGVVLFTTPQCVACKVQQKPALRELADRFAGRVQVIEIDATERPELARQWSVLSVPTTFVLDRNGRPLHVNHGVASAGKLVSQLPADA
jgi:thiol-disulfide isomerase/thioredoxin